MLSLAANPEFYPVQDFGDDFRSLADGHSGPVEKEIAVRKHDLAIRYGGSRRKTAGFWSGARAPASRSADLRVGCLAGFQTCVPRDA